MSTIILSDKEIDKSRINAAAFYRMIWRWHFYAGLFCLPFVTILALSGSVYLFKPQIDAFFDRPYSHMSLSSPARSLDDQVEAALAAVPHSRIKGLELRNDSSDAARLRVVDAQGQEQRVLVRPDTLEILVDPTSFEVVRREDFSGKPLIDKVVGVGVAAHEGHLFGVANQVLGLFTALSFLTLVVTSMLMWLRRRPKDALGAPPALAAPPRLAPALVLLILAMGVFLPTLGVSLMLVLGLEAIARRFLPGVSHWLGLTPDATPV